MDKRIRESKSTNGRLTSGMRGQVLFTHALINQFRRGESKPRKEGEKRRAFRERSSHLSLNFLAIGPSNPNETRGKVDPHCKSYAWVQVLWSFNKLREVGVFFYLLYSLVKSHLNGRRYLEAWMAMF